eukprot:g8034.t1
MEKVEEVSSRQKNLEDELRRVKDTVASLDSQIDNLKHNAGWTLNTAVEKLPNEAHAQLWRKLLDSGPVAEAYRELPLNSGNFRPPVVNRGKKGKPPSGRPGGRGRSLETPRFGKVKRNRTLTSKEKRLESLWNQCGSILNHLKKHRYAWPFLQPVDAVALNIPDYHDVIKRPIDLGTISRKLDHDQRKGRYRDYKTPFEFRDDVRLVWTNCRTYNKPGQDVRIMGDAVSETWEKKWSQSDIESRWLAEQDTAAIDDEEEEAEGVVVATHSFIDDELGREGKGTTTTTLSLSERRRGTKEQTMSFLDKRKLAQQIGSLNSEQVAAISELLSTLKIVEDDGEILLDLEMIDAKTLWVIKHKTVIFRGVAKLKVLEGVVCICGRYLDASRDQVLCSTNGGGGAGVRISTTNSTDRAVFVLEYLESFKGVESASYELWRFEDETTPHVLFCPIDWMEALNDVCEIVRKNNHTSFLICGQSQSGKSTFCRYLANSLLNETELIGFLDIDPGQREITPPGLLTLHLLNGDLYTFPFSSQGELLSSYFLGCLSPSVTPLRYLECVNALIEDWKRFLASQNGNRCTLIVNSSGWIQAMGREILCEICTKFFFDKVYLLDEKDPDSVGEISKSLTILQGFQTFGNGVSSLAKLASYVGKECSKAVVKDPVFQRELMWTRWMHSCLKKDHLLFPVDSTAHKQQLTSLIEAKTPIMLNLEDIDIEFVLGEYKPYENSLQDLARQLNLAVIGLCCKNDTRTGVSLSPCLGLAFVRSVTKTKLFLLTDLNEQILSRVDQIQVPQSLSCRAIKVKYPDDEKESEVRQGSGTSRPSETRTRPPPAARHTDQLVSSIRSSQHSGISERSEGNDMSRRAPSQSSDDRISFSPTKHKHNKSHSSVSSFGKRLVGMLVDEVVEDFIDTEPIPFDSNKGSVSYKSTQSSMHRANISCNASKGQTTITRPSTSVVGSLQNQRGSKSGDQTMETSCNESSAIVPDLKVQKHEVNEAESDSVELDDSEILDSAWSTREQSFVEKRAFFEERTRRSILTPPPRLNGEDRTQSFQQRQLNTNNRDSTSEQIKTGVQQVAAAAASGSGSSRTSDEDERFLIGSRIPTASTSQLAFKEAQSPSDDYRPNEHSTTGCVVRRVFRASSIADGETESSDESVMSLEVSSSSLGKETLDENSSRIPVLGKLREV